MAIRRFEPTVYRRPKAGAFARVVVIYDDTTLDIAEIFVEQEGMDDSFFQIEARPTGRPPISKTQRGGRPTLDAAGLKMGLATPSRGGPPVPHFPVSLRVSARPPGAANG